MDPLPRPVRLLGWTSLFTDAASEAIYPLLPVFVTTIVGGGAAALGLIEGAAEAASSVLKLLSGRVSDRVGRRKPFAVGGYALAAAARPLVALATSWTHVFAVRFVDRVGKGMRGAPRDAMLAALAPPGERGRVFGYHRAMDHMGAVIGPLGAAVFLWFAPGEYRLLFALSVIPGALAVATVLRVPETPVAAPPPVPAAPPEAVPPRLRRFLVVLAVFTLGNSTDAFLLLRLSDAGVATAAIPLLWAGLHVVKAVLSTPGGRLSDRVGRRALIAGGWCWYAVVYAGFALSDGPAALVGWFLAYGAYFGLAEGSEKALVADLAGEAARGTAFGWYNAVLGLGALAASVAFGAVWELVGPAAAFLAGAGLALLATLLLLLSDDLHGGRDH
ncbi:MAG: MFS transporter [Vicinamibacterales bacterium]